MERQWEEIIHEVIKRIPNAEIPVVNMEEWTEFDFIYDKIKIVIYEGTTKPSWSDVEFDAFRDIVLDLCGPIPDHVSVEFSDHSIDWG